MCSSFKVGYRNYKIQHTVLANGIEQFAGKSLQRLWEGFARQESLLAGKWDHRHPINVLLRADEYVDKGCTYPVPEGYGIAAVTAKSMKDNGRSLFVITRESTKEEDDFALSKGCIPHNRHPLLISTQLAIPSIEVLV